jgi:hypothetical protein
MKQVPFLGHALLKGGLSMDPSKVQTVLSWNAPMMSGIFEVFLDWLDIIEGLSKDLER